MNTFLITAVLVGVFTTLLFRGARLMTFTAACAAALLALSATGVLGATGFAIAAAVFAPIALVLNMRTLRQRFLTRFIFGPFRAALPEMNSTEREALEAGDVWWEGEMFRGRPDWQQLHDFTQTQLTEEERSFLENETEELCRLLDDWKITFEQRDLPEEVWQFMGEKGFFGMLISKEWGGLGFSPYAQSCVVTKIATRSNAASVTVMVPNSLGPGELLMHYGTQGQKEQYLGRLARGEEIPCFALTGVEAGSDAAKIPDLGIVEKREIDGEEVVGLRLTFNKRYITLAPVATLVGLAFKLRDPDGLLGDPETVDYGITCALIPHDTPGVEIGRRHYPGAAFMNGPIRGKDVFVPLDAIIGGAEMAGKGWRMLVECLSAGRGISLPAISTATAKGMYASTTAYSKIRRQFGLPIGRFEGVQESLGRIGGLTYRMEAARNLTASAVQHCAPSVVTAMMKYHMTEAARTILNDAMDVHGGKAIQMGPRNYLAAPYQAMPVAITVEGANIMTRNLIVFGQGAIRCHPFVYPEMEAARETDYAKGLAQFDDLFFQHIGFTINRGVRALLLGLTGARLAGSPESGEMAPYYRQLSRYSAAMAFASDVAMASLGGGLKARERTSARLGDVLSHLYMASAVLWYYRDQGGTEADLAHAKWALDYSLAEIDRAFAEFCANFPIRAVGRVLKLFVQPLGRRHFGPDDRLNAAVADHMLATGPRQGLFERLSYDVFEETDTDQATGAVYKAWEKLCEIEPAYERFLKAQKRGEVVGDELAEQLDSAQQAGVLDAAEAAAIREYDALRIEAIMTDDFSKRYIANPAHEVVEVDFKDDAQETLREAV